MLYDSAHCTSMFSGCFDFCPPGKFTKTSDPLGCTVCPADTYSLGFQSEDCRPCDEGLICGGYSADKLNVSVECSKVYPYSSDNVDKVDISASSGEEISSVHCESMQERGQDLRVPFAFWYTIFTNCSDCQYNPDFLATTNLNFSPNWYIIFIYMSRWLLLWRRSRVSNNQTGLWSKWNQRPKRNVRERLLSREEYKCSFLRRMWGRKVWDNRPPGGVFGFLSWIEWRRLGIVCLWCGHLLLHRVCISPDYAWRPSGYRGAVIEGSFELLPTSSICSLPNNRRSHNPNYRFFCIEAGRILFV